MVFVQTSSPSTELPPQKCAPTIKLSHESDKTWRSSSDDNSCVIAVPPRTDFECLSFVSFYFRIQRSINVTIAMMMIQRAPWLTMLLWLTIILQLLAGSSEARGGIKGVRVAHNPTGRRDLQEKLPEPGDKKKKGLFHAFDQVVC